MDRRLTVAVAVLLAALMPDPSVAAGPVGLPESVRGAAGTGTAGRGFELGVQDDPVLLRPPSAYGWRGPRGLLGRDAAYDRLADLGAAVVRINVVWADVEPVAGRREFGLYDEAVAAAAARGRRVQLTLTGPAPRWAAGRAGPAALGGRSNVRPDPGAYSAFAGAAAAHFAGRVDTYSVWNEPNWHSLLRPRRTAPRQYRALFAHGSAAIRAADPAARVLFGEMAPMGAPEAATPPLRFLRRATCSGRAWQARPGRRCAPLVADGFAHHPYTLRWVPAFPGPGPDDVTTGSLHRLHRALRRLARRGALATPAGRAPALFLTEWAFHADSRRIPEPLRARYVAQAVRRLRADPRVRQVIWYQLAAPPRSRERIWDTALLDRAGRPRPTYRVLRRLLGRRASR